jgi:hypothetical protein
MKLHLALHSLAIVSAIALAALLSPFWLTPDDMLVARLQQQARQGSLLGELALRHWAEEGDPIARCAYIEILGERSDLDSEAARVRLLRAAAVTGDGAAAMQLASLAHRMRAAGRGRATAEQIARWYRQGLRAGAQQDRALGAIGTAERVSREAV